MRNWCRVDVSKSHTLRLFLVRSCATPIRIRMRVLVSEVDGLGGHGHEMVANGGVGGLGGGGRTTGSIIR